MTLGQLIDELATHPREFSVKDGFDSPHSDRGSYENLAFAPIPETTIGQMLDFARGAVDKTMEGYKGGDYKMTLDTDVYIGEWGMCGEPMSIHSIRSMIKVPQLNSKINSLRKELSARTAELEVTKAECESLHGTINSASKGIGEYERKILVLNEVIATCAAKGCAICAGKSVRTKSIEVPCPDGDPGCCVRHFKEVPYDPKV